MNQLIASQWQISKKVSVKLSQSLFFGFCLLAFSSSIRANESVARQWNEVLLEAIREDFARPKQNDRVKNIFSEPESLLPEEGRAKHLN